MRAIGKDKNIVYLTAVLLSARLFIFGIFYTHITIFPDSSGYIDLASRLMDFNLSGYGGQRSPGYPLLLLLAFGNSYLAVMYQFLLGTGSALFWYFSLKNFKVSKRISFYTVLFLGLLLNVIFFETAILVESSVLFLLSVVVHQISKGYLKHYSWKTEIGLSLLLGFLVLIKPFYAFLPFLLYGLFLLKNWNWKSVFSPKLVILFFPLVAYFGWSSINKINTGHFVSTTFFGLNTAQNCVRFAGKAPAEYQWIAKPYVEARENVKAENGNQAMAIWKAYNSGAYDKYNLKFSELSAEMGDFANATIRKNPGDYLNQVIVYSWTNFWKPTIVWNYKDFNFKHANQLFAVLWKAQYLVLFVCRLLFLGFVPLQVFKAIRRKRISVTFNLTCIVLTASILQALVTYGSNARFSFPFEFMMVFVVLLSLIDFGILKKMRSYRSISST